jgi:hypothetical protein
MRGQHRPENFEKWIFLKKKGVSVLTLINMVLGDLGKQAIRCLLFFQRLP